MKKILSFLLLAVTMANVNADWIFDSSAKTLTHSTSGVVIKNVTASGTNLTISQQATATDTYAYGNLDFSEPILDANGTEYALEKLNTAAFRYCQGLTGFVAPSTLTELIERPFQESGIVTCDLTRATALQKIGTSTFEKASYLSGDIYIPDSITFFGSWVFSEAGTKGSGFNVYFGASPSPNYVDFTTSWGGGGMFYKSKVSKIDFSKLTGQLTISEKAFREAHNLSEVRLPKNLATLPKFAFNKHRPEDPLLEVYFQSCSITDLAANPFAEMFNGNNQDKYTVTDEDIENSNIIIYIPRLSTTSGTEGWNVAAGEWITLAENSPTWKSDSSRKLFTLPETEDGEGLYVTDYSKTGSTWSDAAVRVKYWDDPIQIEADNKPKYEAEFVSTTGTETTINICLTSKNSEASDVTITLFVYTDPECTQLFTSDTKNISTPGSKAQFIVSELDSQTSYYFTMSGVDNLGEEGGIVELGILNRWAYLPETQSLSLGYGISGSFAYTNVTANGNALTIGANGNDPTVTEIDFSLGIADGYEVTTIANQAFYKCLNLTNVVLGAETTSIGNSAFEGCTSLVSAVATGITVVPESAFSGCTTLKTVTFPNVVEVKNSAFLSCQKLNTADMENLAIVGNSGFNKCTGLITLTSKNLTHVYERGFTECSNWVYRAENISNLQNIGKEAFTFCSKIEGDLVLTNLTQAYISSRAFEECHNITSITLGANINTIYSKAFHKTYLASDVVFLAENMERIETCAFGGHGLINDANAAERSIYMKNVPTVLGNFLSETHAQAGPTDEQIAAEDTIVTMYIPYYEGVIEDAANGVTTSDDQFEAYALAWQNADIPALVGDGSTFILPTSRTDTGLWYNKHNNWGGYIVKIAYYRKPVVGSSLIVY